MEIIPTILEKDFSEIKKKIKKLEPYFNKVQIDIGDGKFVPEEFGCLEKIRDLKTKLEIEVHLMTEAPWKLINLIVKTKVRKITFHYEAFFGVPGKTRAFAINNLINKIKGVKGIKEDIRGEMRSIKVGIAINPETAPYHITDYLKKVDEVLLLGVTPGRQGQKFQEEILEKVNFLRNFRENIKIGVDGGVNDKNIKAISETDINRVYVGSFLWEQKDLKEAVKKLKDF